MSPDGADRGEDPDEAEVSRILAAYLASVESGRPVDPRPLLEQFPHLADPLLACLGETRSADDRAREPDHERTLSTERQGPAGDPPPLGTEMNAPVRHFGDYVLIREIGRGGMGVVYEARQRSLNRPVALKMVRGGRDADAIDLQRFRAESEAVAALDHPNIVPIYEIGEYDGYPYFSMRLIEGGSLSGRLGRFAGDPRAAAELLVVVARAIDHAHRRGVLHRDLKPSNILLDAEDRPLVADFGLARRIGGDHELTRSGTILGSPPYMAPEQAAGRRDAVTSATDIYGLGALLYALITGRPPFEADSVLEIFEKLRDRPPVPPGAINPRVDRDLQTACLKCLEKDPDRRYESARELADDLERWLGGRPIRARPVGRAERLARWSRRPARAVEAGAFVAGVSALLIAWNILGIAMVAAGVGLAIPRPAGFIADSLLAIAAFYLPALLAGLGTIAGHRWAPRLGIAATLFTAGGMFLTVLDAPWMDFGGFFAEAQNKLSVLSILMPLMAVESSAFLLACFARPHDRPGG